MDVEAAAVFPMYFPGLQITHANYVSEALREALAAALLADAQQSFSAINSDALELGEVQLVQTDTARWAVSGEGALLQGKERPERIGFRFQAEFDAALASLGQPRLQLGGVEPGERYVPNDPAVIRSLEDALIETFSRDLGEVDARLRLDRIDSVEAGQRLLRVTAEGLADFGLSGTGGTTVDAVFDVAARQWLSLDYTLSSDDGWKPGRPAPISTGARRMALVEPASRPVPAARPRSASP